MLGTLGYIVAGFVVMALAVIWFLKQKPTFVIVLTTAAGEVRAYESQDHGIAGEILNALNEAIVAHSSH